MPPPCFVGERVGNRGWIAKRPVWLLSKDPVMPLRRMPPAVTRIPKQRFRVTNWAESDASLRQRGSLTVWFIYRDRRQHNDVPPAWHRTELLEVEFQNASPFGLTLVMLSFCIHCSLDCQAFNDTLDLLGDGQHRHGRRPIQDSVAIQGPDRNGDRSACRITERGRHDRTFARRPPPNRLTMGRRRMPGLRNASCVPSFTR